MCIYIYTLYIYIWIKYQISNIPKQNIMYDIGLRLWESAKRVIFRKDSEKALAIFVEDVKRIYIWN